MAKKDSNQADEQPVVENQDNNEEVQVELDRHIDVEGDLVDNPTIEEVADEPDIESNPAEPGEEESTAETELDESSESAEPQTSMETTEEVEPANELEAEADETGVYEQPTAPNPGEFTLKGDYSFEITTTDGKTHKINTPQEAEAFAAQLDENPDLITASQYTKFNRSVLRMDMGIEREQQQYANDKELFDQQQEQERVRTEQIQQWSNELRYLETKGLISQIDAAKDADWLANAKDQAVKERMEIFQWMQAENKAREAAGIQPVMSAVDAFQLMQAEKAQQTEVEQTSRERQTRQQRGSMIGGNAPHVPTHSYKNSIVGEGGSLNDLLHEYNMEM